MRRIATSGGEAGPSAAEAPAPRGDGQLAAPRADVWRQILAERSEARGPSDPPPATIRGLYSGTIPPKSDADPLLVTLSDEAEVDAGDRVTPPVVIPEPPPTSHARGRSPSRRARALVLVGLAAAGLMALVSGVRNAPQSEPPPLPPLVEATSPISSP